MNCPLHMQSYHKLLFTDTIISQQVFDRKLKINDFILPLAVLIDDWVICYWHWMMFAQRCALQQLSEVQNMSLVPLKHAKLYLKVKYVDWAWTNNWGEKGPIYNSLNRVGMFVSFGSTRQIRQTTHTKVGLQYTTYLYKYNIVIEDRIENKETTKDKIWNKIRKQFEEMLTRMGNKKSKVDFSVETKAE